MRNLELATLTCLLLASLTASAQVEHGGTPLTISRGNSLPPIEGTALPAPNLAELSVQDAINDQDKGTPYRFGFNHAVDFDLGNSGTWGLLEDGTRVWRMEIECPGAISINFEFHEYHLPLCARVFVINGHGDHIGAFTHENSVGGVLGVQPMRGDRIIVEYQVPAKGPIGRLRIGQVTHGYRDVFGYARALGESGSCNNNVVCPEGDPWDDQIRSVAMIVVGGSGICTGTLLNNCAQNGTPYFLTARHCLPSPVTNVSTWVFRFNWQSSVCNQNLNGPTNQTVSGATHLVNNAGSDVALLQLSSAPPAGYGVYYSGWDRSGTAPTSSTCIHHPSGDIKKISFDVNAATTATYGSATCWRIAAWEDGTTEPGSSGSGLWNQSKRIIGQLYGGEASCSNNVNDYFGKFSTSWTSLSTYLGSCGNTLDGWDPNAATLALDAQVTGITGASGNNCSGSISPIVTVRNGGLTTLTSFQLAWSISGGASGNIPWTGSLVSGASTDVAIGTVSLPSGYLTFTATVSAPNGSTDQNLANNTSTSNITYGPNSLTLQLNLDRYGSETTWVIRNGSNIMASGGPYTTQASNGVYPQPPIVVCVPNGCHELVVYDSWGDGICCAFGAGSFTLRDAQNNTLVSNANFTGASTTHSFCVTQSILAAPKVFLEGPYGTGPIMSDALRTAALVPATEPFTALGFTHFGSGGETINANVLNTTGNNAIVDWVFLQLRGTTAGYPVIATRCALVQRDGDVVDMDGSSAVAFTASAGNYHVAVLHRNHLGAMTATTRALSGTATTVDFTVAATTTYGTEARKTIGSALVLWAGNCNADNTLAYTGAPNDRDPILVRIGGSVPTNTVIGYYLEDVNLDGVVSYTGTLNDRDPILVNIGGSVPTAVRQAQLP
ncbi:MAG: trypsin-like peptidase domain-containing protein [Flavobacteriales bacterium]|nr:trypsin-like peptidase domain-containing protein [Flavobacteriales bacterium]